MLVEFGQANLLAKARSQPDKVRQVLAKVKTDGLLPSVDAVFSKLDQPLALGYCNAGVVLAVGAGVSRFQVGDRVVSNGKHAEIVSVPQNLCACIPDGVTDGHGRFHRPGFYWLAGYPPGAAHAGGTGGRHRPGPDRPAHGADADS
jgi:hypothetical protein